MNQQAKQGTRYQVCVPKSQEHRRAMKWFSSLLRTAEDHMAPKNKGEDEVSLQHSMQLYSVYAETGDRRYLDLCEDFLKYSLHANRHPRPASLR